MQVKYHDFQGIAIACFIIFTWGSFLYALLSFTITWYNPFVLPLIFIQTHLFTGLFITGHDAMHSTISAKSGINKFFGYLCSLLFAFNWYPRLYKKHHLHHRFPGSDQDPDYSSCEKFFDWYIKFLKEYITIWQLLLMALTFNILKLFFPEINIFLFWVIPSVLSTFQLFYFGTYLPHKGEHEPDNKHRARSQNRNHIKAFLTCYFFGYHREHHNYPYVPWWKLYKYR